LVKKDSNKFDGEVNLIELGYHKLLGSGNISKKLNVKVKYSSKKATEKIEGAGGKVLLE
jgi:large subunit ribosomal protein L15